MRGRRARGEARVVGARIGRRSQARRKHPSEEGEPSRAPVTPANRESNPSSGGLLAPNGCRCRAALCLGSVAFWPAGTGGGPPEGPGVPVRTSPLGGRAPHCWCAGGGGEGVRARTNGAGHRAHSPVDRTCAGEASACPPCTASAAATVGSYTGSAHRGVPTAAVARSATAPAQITPRPSGPPWCPSSQRRPPSSAPRCP